MKNRLQFALAMLFSDDVKSAILQQETKENKDLKPMMKSKKV